MAEAVAQVVDVPAERVRDAGPSENTRARRRDALRREVSAAFKRPGKGGERDMYRGDGDETANPGRPSLGSGSVWFMMACEAVALVSCWILLGIDFAFVLQFSLAAVYAMDRPHLGMVLANGMLGLYAATLFTGFVLWPSSVVGGFLVLSLAFRFLTTASPSTGDVNPVAYIVAIVALRTYLATFYSSISGFDTFSSNILTWLAVFVVGIVPGWPAIANVISSVLLNGTLAVYLTLLLKRIANPVAN